MLILKIFSFAISLSYFCFATNRVKRVYNGTRLIGRTGPYDAVRYMVAIGTIHGVPWYTFGFHKKLVELGAYGTINCGGSLLTPSIIQTACHCVASFDDTNSKSRPPLINYHWELIRVIYIGLNDRFGEPFSMMTRPPVASLKFFVHKLCQKLQQGITLENISHDFGLIKVDPIWSEGDSRVPTANVQYAPLYTMSGLQKTYQAFLKNPPVCLNLGYGVYDDKEIGSDFIRAGWTHLIKDNLCQVYTCHNLSASEIKTYKNWVCAEEFPQHYNPVLRGDSGSPFTCNNAYFGVVSQSLKQTDGKMSRRIGIYGSVSFTLYENAWEFRAAFDAEINKDNTGTFAELVERIYGSKGKPTSVPRLLDQEIVIRNSSAPALGWPGIFIKLQWLFVFCVLISK